MAVAYGCAMTATEIRRLTSYAHGGGCACMIPPGELLVGLDDGDDAAEVLRGGAEVAGCDGCHVAGGHSVGELVPRGEHPLTVR